MAEMKGRYVTMSLTSRNFFYGGALTVALSGFLLGGCTQTTEVPTTTASAPAESAPPVATDASPSASANEMAGTNSPGTTPPAAADAPPMAGGGGAPFAGGMGGDPNAPLSPSPDLDKKVETAEKSKDKKAITAAYTERGAARMYDEKAGQRTKYRAALEDFRKALAADPTNKDAQASKSTIESIYTSMGRPIPE